MKCWEEILYSQEGEVLAQLPRLVVAASFLQGCKLRLNGVLGS